MSSLKVLFPYHVDLYLQLTELSQVKMHFKAPGNVQLSPGEASVHLLGSGFSFAASKDCHDLLQIRGPNLRATTEKPSVGMAFDSAQRGRGHTHTHTRTYVAT